MMPDHLPLNYLSKGKRFWCGQLPGWRTVRAKLPIGKSEERPEAVSSERVTQLAGLQPRPKREP